MSRDSVISIAHMEGVLMPMQMWLFTKESEGRAVRRRANMVDENVSDVKY